jgi:hypothetical protein
MIFELAKKVLSMVIHTLVALTAASAPKICVLFVEMRAVYKV